MATLNDLANGIIADARLQAEKIDAETQAQVAKINTETNDLLQAEKQRLEQQAKEEMQHLTLREQAKQELAARQEILHAKQAILDETFDAAKRALQQMTVQQRKAFLKRLLERTRKEMSIGSMEVAKQDIKLIGKISGVKSIPIASTGGFIATAKDGKVHLDMRFETLLADVQTHKTAEIAAVLFAPTQMKKAVKKPKQKKVVRKKKQ